MLRYLILATIIPLILPEFLLLKLALKVYRKYHLNIFKIKIIVAILSIFYLLVSLAANLVIDYFVAFLLFNISILIIVISGLLLYIYFYILRAEEITPYVLTLCLLLVFFKGISLLMNPIKVYVLDDIMIREAHLSPFSVLISSIIISLIIFELARLHKYVKRKIHYKKYSRAIAGTYSMIIIMIPLFIIGSKFKTISILIPYLQGALTSFVMLYLVLYFQKNPEKVVLLPVYVRGFLIHTYGGLSVVRRAISREAERLVVLASALVASLISLEATIIKLGKEYKMRTYDLIDSKILILFGKKSVGTVIINRDNSVVRNILNQIISEFEDKIGSIDEGMITNREIDLANSIINKYIEFLI